MGAELKVFTNLLVSRCVKHADRALGFVAVSDIHALRS